MIRQFIRDETGVTSIEYGLIAGLVSVIILTATLAIGVKLNAKFLGPVAGGLN